MATATNGNLTSNNAAEYGGNKSELGKDLKDLGKMTGVLAADAVHMVRDNASQYYDQGMEKAKKFEKKIEARIQNHPMQSLLIVAGIGLVLGTLWNRR